MLFFILVIWLECRFLDTDVDGLNPGNHGLITSAGQHTRAPTTVYPVCGDLIVVLDRNRNSMLGLEQDTLSALFQSTQL